MRSLAFKEWLKLKPWLILLVIGHLVFAAFFVLGMWHQFRIEHAEMIYYQANRIGRLFYADIRYLPLATGVVLGAAQFLPEVLRGRMRLSMHLPVALSVLTLSYLAIGTIVLSGFLVLDSLVLVTTVGTFFPREFAISALMTAAPWLLAGIAAYLGTALVLLEPVRRFQAVNLALVASVVALCFLSNQYNAYQQALWGLGALVALLVPGVLRVAARFRDGGTT